MGARYATAQRETSVTVSPSRIAAEQRVVTQPTPTSPANAMASARSWAGGHRGANTPAIRARRRIIKGTCWVLLHLWVVYVLKDALKELWRYTYVGAALHS